MSLTRCSATWAERFALERVRRKRGPQTPTRKVTL